MKNILIVDDDEDLLFCYQLLLRNESIRIHTASKAEDALNILRTTRIDVAILDYMLPSITGSELAKQINEIDPDVIIYFISGYDDVLKAAKKLNINVYGVFKKPVDPALLSQVVWAEDHVQLVQNSELLLFYNLYSNMYSDTQPREHVGSVNESTYTFLDEYRFL